MYKKEQRTFLVLVTFLKLLKFVLGLSFSSFWEKAFQRWEKIGKKGANFTSCQGRQKQSYAKFREKAFHVRKNQEKGCQFHLLPWATETQATPNFGEKLSTSGKKFRKRGTNFTSCHGRQKPRLCHCCKHPKYHSGGYYKCEQL